MYKLGLFLASEASVIDWSTVKFDGVLGGVKEAIPFLIPTVVGFIALRKGWGFVMGQIKRA